MLENISKPVLIHENTILQAFNLALSVPWSHALLLCLSKRVVQQIRHQWFFLVLIAMTASMMARTIAANPKKRLSGTSPNRGSCKKPLLSIHVVSSWNSTKVSKPSVARQNVANHAKRSIILLPDN